MAGEKKKSLLYIFSNTEDLQHFRVNIKEKLQRKSSTVIKIKGGADGWQDTKIALGLSP